MSKNSSDHLFQLIHGMNSSEKRYFKRFLLLHGGSGTSSGRLFDAYNRQTVFDEAQLKKTENYLSGFAQQKKQLYEILMRSLRAYHSGSNTDMKIRSLLSDAEILRQMRLYDTAHESLKKAERLAKQTESILMHAEVLRKTDELYFDIRKREGYNTHQAVLEKEQHLLHLYQELITIKQLAKASYAAHYEEPTSAKNKIRFTAATPGSLSAQRLLLNGKMAQALASGKAEHALQFAVSHVTLLEQHPLLVADYPYEYLKALSSRLVLEDTLSKHEACMATIRKMRQLHRQPELRRKLRAFESHTFVYTYTTEFNSLVKQRHFTAALRLVPEIVRGLARPGNRITDSERKVFYQIFALTYLYVGNPRLAFRWSAKALNHMFYERQDLNFSLLLTRMLATYEKNDPEFLQVLLKKDAAKLEETNPVPAFNKPLLELFAMLAADHEPKLRQKQLTAFLEKITQPAFRKKIQPVIDQFALETWIRSQLSGKPMATFQLT